MWPGIQEEQHTPRNIQRNPDGQSIIPLLTQSGALDRDALYWRAPSYTVNYSHTPCSFMIKDGWKLIHYFGDYLDTTGATPPDKNVPFGKLVLGPRTELYHLTDAPSETRDLAAEQPGRVKVGSARCQGSVIMAAGIAPICGRTAIT